MTPLPTLTEEDKSMAPTLEEALEPFAKMADRFIYLSPGDWVNLHTAKGAANPPGDPNTVADFRRAAQALAAYREPSHSPELHTALQSLSDLQGAHDAMKERAEIAEAEIAAHREREGRDSSADLSSAKRADHDGERSTEEKKPAPNPFWWVGTLRAKPSGLTAVVTLEWHELDQLRSLIGLPSYPRADR